jgi:hypothetical protein
LTKSVKEEKTMEIQWIKDADAALAQATEQAKPLLIDFSAAPG